MRMKIASALAGLGLMAGLNAANADEALLLAYAKTDNSTEPMQLTAAQMDEVTAGGALIKTGDINVTVIDGPVKVNILSGGGKGGCDKNKGCY